LDIALESKIANLKSQINIPRGVTVTQRPLEAILVAIAIPPTLGRFSLWNTDFHRGKRRKLRLIAARISAHQNAQFGNLFVKYMTSDRSSAVLP
jgi:hypothetical protein